MRTALMLLACAGMSWGCGGGNPASVGGMPMGRPSSDTGAPAGAPALLQVTPPAGSRVAVDAVFGLHFGAPMAPGMERYFDLHHGTSTGPSQPLHCTWNADRTVAECTHDPLHPGTPYLLHVGGGLQGADGRPCDLGTYGPGQGGQWLGGDGQHHSGGSWNGHHGSGMVFRVTTLD